MTQRLWARCDRLLAAGLDGRQPTGDASRMGITFRVDDVEPAREPPKTTTLRALRGAGADVIALGGDPNLAVLDIGDVDPLFAAVHCAFSEHRPLVLTPDAVWLTIARGIAHHVRLNAEALRGRLVRHTGKRTLTVTIDSAFESEPAWIAAAVAKTREALAAEIGDGRARLLVCDFSTTTDVDRTASEIILLDTYSAYYDYMMVGICGIPEVTVEGTPSDWRSIRARIDVIAELDLERWAVSLRTIADALIRASEEHPDPVFFRDIYKPRRAYGPERATGWLTRLYPYVASGGEVSRPNPLLDLAIGDTPPSMEGPDAYWDGPGLSSLDVPALFGSCTATIDDRATGRRFGIALDGGLGAVSVDVRGRVQPVGFWRARRATSLAAFVARLEAAGGCTAPVAMDARLRPELVAVRELYERIGSADVPALRIPPWRPFGQYSLRPEDRAGPRYGEVVPVAHLPDGTTVALAHDGVVALLPTAALPPYPASRSDGIHVFSPGECPLRASEIDALVGDLATVLDAILDGTSSAELPRNGTLTSRAPTFPHSSLRDPHG